MGFFVAESEMGERLLPFLLQSVHQGISVIDNDLNIVLMNEAACSMLDLPVEILEADSSLESVFRFNAKRGDYGPGDVEELVADRMDLARQFIGHEIERERPDGRIIKIQGTPLEDAGFVTVYTDVTEQRANEARLESDQHLLKEKLEASTEEIKYTRDLLINAIDAIDNGLVILDENDNLALANAHMQDLYPVLKRHLAQNSPISEIAGFQLPSQSDCAESLNNDECVCEEKLHDDRWYRIKMSDTINGGRIAVYSDITSYKEQTSKLQGHTNELVKLLQKEIALSETQREFVTMASHEFKTPLAIIDSNARRIQRKHGQLPAEKIEQRATNIRSSVERMQYLINRFMDFSTDEIAGIRIDAKKQNFREKLSDLCKSFAEMNEGSDIRWDLEELPQFAGYDENLLDQCFSNVLSNAVKYSPKGQPIRITARRNTRYLMIDVVDQGVGIPKSELSKIFNKYFRASTSSGIAGTGIGLNFAQMVLKEHGGHIEVKSEVGKGSCFTIFLPVSIVKDDQEPDVKPTEQSKMASFG